MSPRCPGVPPRCGAFAERSYWVARLLGIVGCSAVLGIVLLSPAARAQGPVFDPAAFGSYEYDFDLTPLVMPELSVWTCDEANAGTDDDVTITVTDKAKKTYVTHVNTPEDALERGKLDVLSIAAPKTLGEIDSITIDKRGSDAWCIAAIQLAVNGERITKWKARDPRGPLDAAVPHKRGEVWLDDQRRDAPASSVRFWDYRTAKGYRGLPLRRTAAYRSIERLAERGEETESCAPTHEITLARLRNAIARAVGEEILEVNADPPDRVEKVRWSSLAVRRKSSSAYSVDIALDVAYEVLKMSRTGRAYVSFDLVVSCSKNELAFAAQNPRSRIDVPRWVTALSRLFDVADKGLLKALSGSPHRAVPIDIEGSAGSISVPLCPKVAVDSVGTLHMTWPHTVRASEMDWETLGLDPELERTMKRYRIDRIALDDLAMCVDWSTYELNPGLR